MRRGRERKGGGGPGGSVERMGHFVELGNLVRGEESNEGGEVSKV